MKAPPRGALVAAAVLLGLLAAVLLVGAFTRFDRGTPPPEGSPEVREWNAQLHRDARLSILLGVASAFSLFGCFACGQLASRNSQSKPDAGASGPRSPSKRS